MSGSIGLRRAWQTSNQGYHSRCLVLQTSQLLVSSILFRGSPIPFPSLGRFEPTFQEQPFNFNRTAPSVHEGSDVILLQLKQVSLRNQNLGIGSCHLPESCSGTAHMLVEPEESSVSDIFRP